MYARFEVFMMTNESTASIFRLENGGSISVGNVGKYLTDYTVSFTRR